MTPSASNPIQILLLNNDAIARAGVKLLLENKPGFKVVGQAGEKEQALKLVEQEHPDIILVHGCMDEPLGTGLFTELIGNFKKTAHHSGDPAVRSAISHGSGQERRRGDPGDREPSRGVIQGDRESACRGSLAGPLADRQLCHPTEPPQHSCLHGTQDGQDRPVKPARAARSSP